MEKKWFFILALLAISVTLFIFSSQTQSLSPTTALTTCNTLLYNGEDKINLVFFSNEHQAQQYANFLSSTPPFSKDSFNIYYINEKPECELYKDIALFCHSQSLVKKAASCPNDIIIAFDEKPSQIRSSSYQNVLSINTAHPLSVFSHEFGHAFANLAEEYVPAQLPKNSKNCQSSCDEFNINDGCFPGCSQSNLQRSINAGVMRTLSSNQFGKFNENIIKEKLNQQSSITGQATLIPVQECTAQEYYLIEGNYDSQNNKINIISKTIEQGCPSGQHSGDFNYQIILDDNSIIQEGDFNPIFIFTDVEGQEIIDGEVLTSDKPFTLSLPIIPNSKSLEIYSNNQLIHEEKLNDIGALPCII